MSSAAERAGCRPGVCPVDLVCDGVRRHGAVRRFFLVRVRCWPRLRGSRLVRAGCWPRLHKELYPVLSKHEKHAGQFFFLQQDLRYLQGPEQHSSGEGEAMTFVQIDTLGIARLRYLAATNITTAKQ